MRVSHPHRWSSRVFPFLLAGLLVSSLRAADPVFTKNPDQTTAQALTAFESRLDDAQRERVNQALRWLAQHRELDWSLLRGKTAAQIVAVAKRDQGYHAAALAHAQRTPERITFAAGAVEARAEGDLGPHGMQPFVIAAEAGQKMHVRVKPSKKLPSPVGEPGEPPLILIIYGKDGTVLMTDHSSSNSFEGTLPSTQDYNVDVRSLVEAESKFTIFFKIVTPAEKSASPNEGSATSRESAESVAKATLADVSWQSKPLKPGRYEWHPDVSKEGPVNVIVSLTQQEAFVYRGGVLIGRTTVSTGRKGHRTPTGIFHILSKQTMHHSNKYGNAPMPFSERLTWSGIFLHAGIVPGYESSHGCIHLPYDFARDLYTVTTKGAPVIITKERVVHATEESQKFTVMAAEPPAK